MDEMLTTTFRSRSLTAWQREALEEAATIYARGVVALCRWADENLDMESLISRPPDAMGLKPLLPDVRELVPDTERLHSSSTGRPG